MDDNLSKNVRDDLIIFKNETLKDIKDVEKSLLEKYRNTEYVIMEKMEIFDSEFKKFHDKIIEISAFIENIKDAKDNIQTLLAYKTKSENSILDLDLKLRTLDKESHESLYNISSILKNSVIYPGVISSTSRFKTFHDLIDYFLQNISQLRQFRDKMTKEVNENRIRQDSNFDKLKANFDVVVEKTKAVIANDMVAIEEKNNSFFRLYDEKFQNFRMENAKYEIIIKNNEKLVNNFKEQIKTFEKENNELILKYNDLHKNYTHNNKEINKINDKFSSLLSYIKKLSARMDNGDKRVSGNKGDEINDILFPFDEETESNKELMKIKMKKNESGLKAYIKGKISINQFQNLQNRSNFKSSESSKNFNNNNNYNNNNIEQEENENNKIRYFSGKPKAYKTISIFKEEKISPQKKEIINIKRRNLVDLEYSNNSYNNTLQNSKDINNYLRRSSLSISEKSSDNNLLSNHKFNRKNLKYLTLKIDEENEAPYNNSITKKSEKYNNLLQNQKSIKKDKDDININNKNIKNINKNNNNNDSNNILNNNINNFINNNNLYSTINNSNYSNYNNITNNDSNNINYNNDNINKNKNNNNDKNHNNFNKYFLNYNDFNNNKKTNNKNNFNIMNDFNNKNNINFNIKSTNYLSGFPKIVTNQGERIIISSHPVFHRHKFTKNVTPNILSLNKANQKFFSNLKENQNTFGNNKKNMNNIHTQNAFIEENYKNVYKENKGLDKKKNNIENESYINNKFKTINNNTKIEEERGKKFIDYKGRNNSFQNIKVNKYYKLMNNNLKKV